MGFHDLLARLDRASLLGFKIWEFSFRSLRTTYGMAFIREVVLRHPIKALAGIFKYRRFLREHRLEGDITCLFGEPERESPDRVTLAEADLLVAVGFCQKPLAPECPAGRPNHDCVFLEELHLEPVERALHPACGECEIRSIGLRALRAGACMHIMTSALDIARDVMIPSINHRRFKSTIMCLCPYSVQAITLPLMICGMEGYLIGYTSGNCMDYEQWSLADRGVKSEMTTLSAAARDKIRVVLEAFAEQREREGAHYVRFMREGNIYVPCTG